MSATKNAIETSQKIVDVIHDNIKTIFPLSVGNKTLTIKNVQATGWENADPTNYHAIAEAKAKDKTYGVNIVGDVELHENGVLIDKKKMKLATAPITLPNGWKLSPVGKSFALGDLPLPSWITWYCKPDLVVTISAFFMFSAKNAFPIFSFF